MINVAAIVDSRSQDEASFGLKPNVTRNRYIPAAAAMIAEHHGVRLDRNDSPNVAVYRSYMVVDCYICGATVSNGGWQFEHINDDGAGLAGDALAEAIVKGTEDASKCNFGCGTCNAAKNAERAFKARLAKAQ